MDSTVDSEVEEIMDTSKQYIKMCKKADEIQALHPQVMVGSIKHYYRGDYQYEIDSDGIVRFWNDHCFIWLPRQDQLQEMVGFTEKNCGWFYKFTSGHYPLPDNTHFHHADTCFNSMEQLWLAFIMKQEYNKVWDGGDWNNE